MAFLIVEDNFDHITTGIKIDEQTQTKKYYIEGVFLQAEQKNRNGRIYPANILEREVNRYTKQYINTNRSLGELNHPKSPSVNPERACHFIKSLTKSGNNWIGKSQITSTPVGDIVKGLLDDGVQLGVSSRGLGTLSERSGVEMVNEDYYMSTIDVVSDPSAPEAWVNGIYEGKEWAVQGEDEFVERMKKEIDKEASRKGFSMFEEFVLIEKMNKFFDHITTK